MRGFLLALAFAIGAADSAGACGRGPARRAVRAAARIAAAAPVQLVRETVAAPVLGREGLPPIGFGPGGRFRCTGVRDRYPLLCNRVPTAAWPGTPEKLAVLEERARLGEQLWHPLDGGGCDLESVS